MAESDSGDTSERYEFDAPTHVVDFKELVNSQTDDTWFENVGGADGHLITPSRPDKLLMQDDEGRTSVIPDKNVDSGQSISTSPPTNIVTSWGSKTQNGGQPRKKTAKEHSAQPCRVSKRKEMTTRPTAPPSKKQKETPVRKPRSGQLKLRSSCRRRRQLSAKVSPKTHQTASSSTNTERSTSEDLEMERIRNLQREVALHRKKNEASYKAALAGNPPPKKMLLSATVPQEFHFNTDTRIKASASSNTSHKAVDFIHQLRKPSSPVKTRRGATVPKPFNLSKGNKKKEDEPGTYVSMAQQIEQFQKRTPPRYHMRSHRSQERGPSPVKGNPHLKLTQPHSPHLMTRQRSRPTTIKSSAELEAEEVEQLQKFKIKAQELNKKILEGPEELKRPAVKEPTVPEGFELEIERRLQERQATKKPQESEEKPNNFKAKPLPKKVLEGVVGLPDKKVPYPTVPESPAFALKKRVRLDRKVEEVKPPSPVKAPPVPHFGLPFQPRLPEHHVEVCPFSFEQRERERRALKEKRLEEMRNEEVPQFKAKPLPDFDTVVLPERKKLEPTKPEPFRLLIDERGAVKNSCWEQMVKEEQKHQEEAAVFKARPNTVVHKEPFRPKKESRSAVVVEAFELATERRAREWQEYERMVSEKEALRARMEVEQRREEEQKVKEEIARLRQEQVHKAQPVRHYKPVAVKKSEVPLTVPESPNFSDRFRL
ncbi:targeting protein for Xklp2 isoform X2 [Melanotaenia boesemani]|uniref:targeting protein for Xklp2 isoform X2 n=1 Tax=Melanotaenia boesemani TaxID=1250792 RepID=UPI001C054C1F|nr:targeting protein for Xklp2 isoform X2 [Melanotaenia boesemani]